MRTIWLTTSTLGDIRDARDWYEARQTGLGDSFVDAVDRAIACALDYPDACPIVYRGARRYLVERFPYSLYYRAERDAIVVVACLHVLRDPKHMRRRLRR